MTKSPPTPPIPDMALVTLMSGECSAGVTPHTTRYPIKPANPVVKTLDMNKGVVYFPRATIPPITPERAVTSLAVFCHGVSAVTSSTLAGRGAAGFGAGDGGSTEGPRRPALAAASPIDPGE